jgi:heme A synthase
MLVLGASGGITALGDTLLLTAGITPEESPLVAALVDLRIYHPLLAFVVGGLVALAAWTARSLRPSPQVNRLMWILIVTYGLQLVIGAINVVLKAPVALQLIHLLVSDVIWISLVLLAVNALAVEVVVENVSESTGHAAPLAGHTV